MLGDGHPGDDLLLKMVRVAAIVEGADRGVPVARDTSLSEAKASGAGDRPRTGYLNLGKVALYQVSYARSCGFRFYVFSTTPSDSGAASATTDRTRAEYSSTRARERAGSRVDAMTWQSGRSASGTTRTQPPSTNTFTPSVRSTRSLRCFSIIVRITRPLTSHGQNSTAVRCDTGGMRALSAPRDVPVCAS